MCVEVPTSSDLKCFFSFDEEQASASTYFAIKKVISYIASIPPSAIEVELLYPKLETFLEKYGLQTNLYPPIFKFKIEKARKDYKQTSI